MKKLLFITLSLVVGIASVAQHKDQTLSSPGFEGKKKPQSSFFPENRNSKHSFNSGVMNSMKSDTVNITPNLYDSYQSPTFDPTWANRFQTVLDSIRVATGMKGASLAVLVPGQGLLTCVTGISSPGIPMTRARRFGIMSNTKLFIAVTMARLQEQGVLSLDDHLYQWLPAYPNVDSTTTIRQLLWHESGIFDFWNDYDSLWNLMLSDTGRVWTPQEILGCIKAPHFPPGHGFRYSNTNYLLAGMIIEAATGKTWIQKLHDFIFDPLTMDSTFVGVYENRNGPVAAEYVNNIPIINSPVTSEFTQINAAGAILSTAQEMAEWYNSLFSGAVISQSSLNQITDFESTSWYGLGIHEGFYKNRLNYNHNGLGAGYMSLTLYDVQTKSTICLLMNDQNGDFNTRITPIMDVFYDDFPKKQNDAGISNIIAPWENYCSQTVTPWVKLTNFGSSPLTSVTINYKIDSGTPSLFNWSGALGSGDTASVDLPQISVGGGSHVFTCYTTLPEGVPEGYTWNDTTRSNFIINDLPVVLSEIDESFDGTVFPPAGWAMNSSTVFQWGQTSLAHYSGTGSAAKTNYIDNNIGAKYDLDMPLIHIAAGTHPEFQFDYAYALYPGYDGDSLQVFISNNCRNTWQTLFNKGGESLATASPTIDPFYPQTNGDWKHESFSLAADTGDVLIRFRDVCGWGNLVYLDDVKVSFPTGIVDVKSSDNFTVYPNPTVDAININGLPVNSEIQISDLTGKLLMTQKTVNNLTKVDIGMLSKGIYILRSAKGIKKIVKL